MLIKGKTKSGFAYEIESGITNSWKFANAIKRMQSRRSTDEDKFTATLEMVDIIFGEDGEDALVEHLEKTLPPEELAGGVSVVAVLEEVKEILEKIGKTQKN